MSLFPTTGTKLIQVKKGLAKKVLNAKKALQSLGAKGTGVVRKLSAPKVPKEVEEIKEDIVQVDHLKNLSVQELNTFMRDQNQHLEDGIRKANSVRIQEKTEKLSEEQTQALKEENKRIREQLAKEVQYPIYALPVENLSKLTTLIHHEDAIKQGLLVLLEPGEPGTFKVFLTDDKGNKASQDAYTSGYTDNSLVVSHRWLRPSMDATKAHPDSEDNIKLQALKEIVKDDKMHELWPEMDSFESVRFIWMDYFCVPQFNRDLQKKAIRSIPAYFYQSCKFVALVENEDALSSYLSRSWCLLEVVSSRTPRPWYGAYYLPLQQKIFYMSTNKHSDLDWAHFKNPLSGNLTNENDRKYIKDLLAYFLDALNKFKLLQDWQVYSQGHAKEWLIPENLPQDILDMLAQALDED